MQNLVEFSSEKNVLDSTVYEVEFQTNFNFKRLL